MALFSATASFSSPSGQFLVGGALKLDHQRSQEFNKDTTYGNIYLTAGQTQDVYISSDTGASVAPLVYVYLQSSTGNSATNLVSVIYTTGSTDVTIGTLKPGEWMYLPYTRGAFSSSSLKVTCASSANVAVLYAESGSL